MNIKTTLLAILTVGVLFNIVGRVSATELDCQPVVPHIVQDGCVDQPSGPRFQIRR